MKVALAIPHTPWVAERAASMARLRSELCGDLDAYREFTDREPCASWSVKLWTWGAEQQCDWLLQLQDDVIVAPCFWPALRAMLSVLPDEARVVGLSNTHPAAPEFVRRGHRWMRTDAMLIGWAYAIRRAALAEFLADREALMETMSAEGRACEDVVLGSYVRHRAWSVWHPVPTIVDHDTSIRSSYQNDHHSTRRPQATWRDFPESYLTDPSWWIPSGTPELVAMPPQRVCWACQQRGIVVQYPGGFGLCGLCIGLAIGHMLQGSRP